MVQLDGIDQCIMAAKLSAEHWCHKIKAEIPWCLQITLVIQAILYWKGVNKKLEGGQIAQLILNCHAKKVHNHHHALRPRGPTGHGEPAHCTAYTLLNG